MMNGPDSSEEFPSNGNSGNQDKDAETRGRGGEDTVSALHILAAHLRDATNEIELANAGDPSFAARVEALKTENTERRSIVDEQILTAAEMGHILAVELAELERLRGVDELTGISNRYGFERNTDRTLLTTQRFNKPATIAAFDIDDFKQVNDTPGQGHFVGDAVLMHLAAHVQSMLRKSDVFGRLSGGADEFAITLPGTNSASVLGVIDKIKQNLSTSISEAVRGMGFPLAQNITISVGIASTDLVGSYSRDVLMRAADDALNIAKQKGKNTGIKDRVEISRPPRPQTT